MTLHLTLTSLDRIRATLSLFTTGSKTDCELAESDIKECIIKDKTIQ